MDAKTLAELKEIKKICTKTQRILTAFHDLFLCEVCEGDGWVEGEDGYEICDWCEGHCYTRKRGAK